jgi:hypothetical protein
MKFAPVLPPELYPTFSTGKYHFVQAHMIRRNVMIKEWFLHRAQMAHTVILDNGTFELGEPDTKALLDVAEEIHPSYVVVPDVLRNYEKTMNNLLLHGETCKNVAQEVMIVPQGQTVDEWVDCAREMLTYCQSQRFGAFMVGVPKILDGMQLNGRMVAVNWLVKGRNFPSHRIHLLGVHRSFDEVRDIVQVITDLGGVDTTLPVAWALSAIDAAGFRERQGKWPPKMGLDANDFKMTEYDLDEEQRLCLILNNATAYQWINPHSRNAAVARTRTGNLCRGGAPSHNTPKP